MGFELHITRGASWLFSDNPIAPEEWMSIVDQDPELVPDPATGPHFAFWRSEYAPEAAWFDWHDGNVFAKNPDRNTFAKMLDIASWLGGRVQGDEGEEWSSLDQWPENG